MMNARIEQNIQNLTTLWRTAGDKQYSSFSHPYFEYSIVKNSQWPNRLWLKEEISDELIPQIKKQLDTLPEKVIIPIWRFDSTKFNCDFAKHNFQLLFQQIGMSLEPKQKIKSNGFIDLKMVSNRVEAELWSETFSKSFGYKIKSSTLLSTCHEMNYFIAYKEGCSVGSVLTLKTGKTWGIHAMGVTPEYRRQGIAFQIMAKVINSAIDHNIGLLTLQASDMAKELYQQLGFEEQFVIKNYAL